MSCGSRFSSRVPTGGDAAAVGAGGGGRSGTAPGRERRMDGLCPLFTWTRVNSVGAVRGTKRPWRYRCASRERVGRCLPGCSALAVRPWGPRVCLSRGRGSGAGRAPAPAHVRCLWHGSGQGQPSGSACPAPPALGPSGSCSFAVAVFSVPETTLPKVPSSLVCLTKLPTFKQCFGLFQRAFLSMTVQIKRI